MCCAGHDVGRCTRIIVFISTTRAAILIRRRRKVSNCATRHIECFGVDTRRIEGRLRVAERMAACIEDPRASKHVTHSMADIIRFRLLMIAAGYEDGNDADSLRSDPMFKMALDLTPSDRELCSQPTISRLENLPDARALLRM